MRGLLFSARQARLENERRQTCAVRKELYHEQQRQLKMEKARMKLLTAQVPVLTGPIQGRRGRKSLTDLNPRSWKCLPNKVKKAMREAADEAKAVHAKES